jgi:hypothetical protein
MSKKYFYLQTHYYEFAYLIPLFNISNSIFFLPNNDN